jgi:hypothetical protein
VIEAFLELSIPYNPNLRQRLPAQRKYELEMSQEFCAPGLNLKMVHDRDNTPLVESQKVHKQRQ